MKLSNKGFTLVEILAALVILSLVSFLVFGILTSSNKEYKGQVEDYRQLNDTSYVLKVISKDIRSSYDLLASSSTYTFTNKEGKELYVYSFNPSTKELFRNSAKIADNINSLTLISDSSGKVSIKLSYQDENSLQSESVSAEVVFRRGD